MAVVVRYGVALLIVLAAAAFVASVTAQEVCDWECYSAKEKARQDSVQNSSIESVGGDVTTESSAGTAGYTIVVDSGGRGNYKTIQAAINSIPNGNKKRVIIKINNGVYRFALSRLNLAINVIDREICLAR